MRERVNGSVHACKMLVLAVVTHVPGGIATLNGLKAQVSPTQHPTKLHHQHLPQFIDQTRSSESPPRL